ncbi:uncharacterized protein LOC110984088 [Acanthaster planci]|uniref:Uncharacterized protein LOC110984088 n=1 Tax=Acanthaster planci TaxID=133434 RepID=A0A8B7Z1W6_ACAPL|nr:uncharacterized protein LOC110984088 [Acanthaster planci]
MAILKRCLCVDNVRGGSALSAVYSVISSLVLLVLAAIQLSAITELPAKYNTGNITTVSALYVVSVSLVVVSSLLVLWGTSRDDRWFLLPYMIVMPILILWQLVGLISFLYLIISLSLDSTGLFAIVIVVVQGLNFLFNYPIFYSSIAATIMGLHLVLNIASFLAVTSQYQELRDGRGTTYDVYASRRGTDRNHEPFGGMLNQPAHGTPLRSITTEG